MGLINDKPDIISILQNEGIHLIKRSCYYWALCPLHLEKTPSLKIDPHKQLFYCFGCHQHGDVISFIQKYHGLSFLDTLSYLGIKKNGKRVKPDPVQIRKRDLQHIFKQWTNGYSMYLADLLRCLDKAKSLCQTTEDVEMFSGYYHEKAIWQYEFEIMLGNDEEVKFELFRRKYNAHKYHRQIS